MKKSIKKNISQITLKEIEAQDARKFLNLLRALDAETAFLLFEKNERGDDLSKCEEYINKMTISLNSLILIAVDSSGEFVGHMTGEGYSAYKKRHVMKVSIGVLKKYYGIGRLLVQAFIEKSYALNVKRLEGEIMEHNKPSLNLAKKFNFNVEGVKRNAVYLNGQYYNEYLIARVGG